MLSGSGKNAAQWPSFTVRRLLPTLASRSESFVTRRGWVNTTLGNTTTALVDAYQHAQLYLASFARRFNRRYQLDTMTEGLTGAAFQVGAQPYRGLIAG